MLTPVHIFNCQPSRWHIALLLALLLGSAGVLVFLSTYLVVKLLLMLILLGYGGWLIQQARLKTPASILRLCCHDGVWQLNLPDREIMAELSGESIVTPWLIMLRFDLGTKSLTSLIFRDTLGQEGFRQLSVLLRLRFTG